MDTIKSLAVISLLGAVLYGVYVVASKPERPLSPDMEEMARVEGPVIEDGHHDHGDPAPASPPVPPARGAEQMLKDWATKGTPRKHEDSHEGSPMVYETPVKSGPDFVPPPDPLNNRKPAPPEVEGMKFEAPVDDASPAPGKMLEEQDSGSSRSSAVTDEEIEASKQRVQRYAFKQTWEAAQEQVSEDHHREALIALSAFYNDSALTPQEQEELVGWLDALAAKVIYSTEHLVEPAYVVRRESLYEVANKYQVPYLLLKNINGIRDPDVMAAGTKLKVLRGPFHAEVDLTRQEITLFVQNMYAGRFPCAIGSEPVPPGDYTVLVKTQQKEYRTAQGPLAPNDPRNPYGGVYLDLGNGVSIHGSPAESYADSKVGCIGLAPRDADDLFSILSLKESKVVVKR